MAYFGGCDIGFRFPVNMSWPIYIPHTTACMTILFLHWRVVHSNSLNPEAKVPHNMREAKRKTFRAEKTSFEVCMTFLSGMKNIKGSVQSTKWESRLLTPCLPSHGHIFMYMYLQSLLSLSRRSFFQVPLIASASFTKSHYSIQQFVLWTCMDIYHT